MGLKLLSRLYRSGTPFLRSRPKANCPSLHKPSPCSACHSVASNASSTSATTDPARTRTSTSASGAAAPPHPSSWASELVTRTVLHAATAAAAAGLSPQGISDLLSPSSTPPTSIDEPAQPELGDLDGPTCHCCTIRALSGTTADTLSDVLLGFGAQSVVVQEHRPPGAPEQEIFGDGADATPLWDLCDVLVHFPLEDDPEACIKRAEAVLRDAGELRQDGSGLQYELEQLVNQQWVDQIKASYVPIRISDRLYIVPEWSEPDDPSAINILLQPGVAFGTGEHPTTRLCLLALEAWAAVQGPVQQDGHSETAEPGSATSTSTLTSASTGSVTTTTTSTSTPASTSIGSAAALTPVPTPKPGPGATAGSATTTPTTTPASTPSPESESDPGLPSTSAPLGGGGSLQGASVMDYGCGSGVLALAALRLGAAAAVGTDTDGLAVRAAQRNAQLNGLGDRFAVLQCGPSMEEEEPLSAAGMPFLQFDIVVANILRGPLVELRPRLTAYTAPGGRLLLSGILKEQAPEIIQQYSQDFTDFQLDSDGSWACIRAVRST